MTYTAVSWSSGDLVTSTKLGQMTDNDAYFYARYDHLVYCTDLNTNTGNTNYTSLLDRHIYLPHGDRGNLTMYAKICLSGAGGGTGYIKFIIDDTLNSTEMTTTSTSFAIKSATCDVSSLAAGAYSFDIQGKHSTGAVNILITGAVLIITPE